MVVIGQKGFFREKWLYSDKVVVFGQSGCIRAMWLYSAKSGCICAKVVVFRQSGCILGKSCCIQAK